jgi:hypothetical protein
LALEIISSAVLNAGVTVACPVISGSAATAAPATASLVWVYTQQAIVAEIEAEQALVAANRELIPRFEQKIQATLSRIWGEEAPIAPGA